MGFEDVFLVRVAVFGQCCLEIGSSCGVPKYRDFGMSYHKLFEDLECRMDGKSGYGGLFIGH